jgi:carbonic anhydrase/acetyltransferase-like protein (isoleucine patch superfamily)
MIFPYKDQWPEIHETTFVAPSADIIGTVTIGAESSVWFQAVVRGDVNSIVIGAQTNIQDHSMLHVSRSDQPLHIGNFVTVGHRCLLHSCTISDSVLIGMGAIVMDAAQIGEFSIIGAGSLVTQGTKIPPFSLVYGSPACIIRNLTPAEMEKITANALHYVQEISAFYGKIPSPKRCKTHSTIHSPDDDLSTSFLF